MIWNHTVTLMEPPVPQAGAPVSQTGAHVPKTDPHEEGPGKPCLYCIRRVQLSKYEDIIHQNI